MVAPILLPVFIGPYLLPIFVAVSPSCIRPRLVREIPYRRPHAEHLLSNYRGAPHFPWNHVLQRGDFLEPVRYSSAWQIAPFVFLFPVKLILTVQHLIRLVFKRPKQLIGQSGYPNWQEQVSGGSMLYREEGN